MRSAEPKCSSCGDSTFSDSAGFYFRRSGGDGTRGARRHAAGRKERRYAQPIAQGLVGRKASLGPASRLVRLQQAQIDRQAGWRDDCARCRETYGRSWYPRPGLRVSWRPDPFRHKAFTKEERPVGWWCRPGESLRLRYAVVLHAGETDLPQAYRTRWRCSRPRVSRPILPAACRCRQGF